MSRSNSRSALAARTGPYPMGLMVVLATVTMLFSAFVSAVLVRRSGADWEPLRVPPVLWYNTVALVVSSLFVESSRRALRDGRLDLAVRQLGIGAGLGLVFVIGQAFAWFQLAAWGLALRSGPHVAFFYVLSVLHALHLTAGLAALGWTLRRLASGAYSPARHRGLTHAAVFWHFLGGTWLYLFAALLVL